MGLPVALRALKRILKPPADQFALIWGSKVAKDLLSYASQVADLLAAEQWEPY